jgi:hypothetical protein
MTTENPPASTDAKASTPFDTLLNGFVRPETTEKKPDPPPASKREAYRIFLRDQGYRFEEDAEGDFKFRREGLDFLIFTNEDDGNYFDISLPWIFNFNSDEESLRALRAANAINRKFKAVKAVVYDKDVWLTIESFLDPHEAFRNVFDRCLDALIGARREFHEIVANDR